MKVSIFVPCYNENEGIKHLHDELSPTLRELIKRGYDYELMLLDDGSTDDTWDKMHLVFDKLPKVRFLKHKVNQNLGGALRTAIKEAKGDLLIPFDSDCTYSPQDILNMLSLMEKEKADVVIASPFHPNGGKVVGFSKQRLIPSYTASWIYRRLTGSHIYSYTGLFKIYRLNQLKTLKVEADGFMAITEIILKLILKRVKIVEFPTTVGVRKYNDSKMRTFRVTLDHLKLMSKLILRRL